MHRPDIKDSEAYTHLLHQIADPDSGVTKEALLEVRKLKTWTHAETTVQLERRPLRSLVTVDQKIREILLNWKMNACFVQKKPHPPQ